MRKTIFFAACCGIFVWAASTARAEETLITARDPNVLLNLAAGYGRANLTKDAVGDPLIEGKMDGLSYNIFFYGCKEGNDCESVKFEAGWKNDGGEISLERLNEWNRAKLFAQASINNKSGLVLLGYDILLRFGVAEKNLDTSFEVWRSLMKEFHTTVMK
jgi:hypothetical protein